MATFALVSFLVGGALGAVTGRAAGAEVSLSAHVRPAVTATFTDDGVTIRANTPWRVEAEVATDHGQGRALFTGGPTGAGGTRVPVGPEGSIVSVVAQ